MIEVLLIKNVFAGAKHAERFYVDRKSALVVDLLPIDWHDVKENVLPVDGVKRLDWDKQVHAGDRVAFVMVPRGVELTWAAFFKYLAIMFAANVIMRALLPKPPKLREDKSSATYGYNGIEPTRVEGEAIPLYYGKLRVGGQIINEFVDDFGSAGSTYNVLVSLGEGPLQQIAGQTIDTTTPLSSDSTQTPILVGSLYINDSDARDLSGVTMQVRMGTLEQGGVEGFQFSVTNVGVDTSLDGPEYTGSGSIWDQQILNFNAPQFLLDGTTSSNATWTDFGLTYSMTVEAEEAVFKVQVPEGIFFLSGGSVQNPSAMGISVRYIELDGGGAPIATGGPQGDGYVRLRSFRDYLKLSGGATLDYRVPLYNPQTFSLPALGRYMEFFPGINGAAPFTPSSAAPVLLTRTGTLTVPSGGPSWPSAGNPDSFTFECFFLPRSITVGGLTTVSYSLASNATFSNLWFKIGNIGVGSESRSYPIAPGQSVTRYVPYVQLASGVKIYEGIGQTFADASYQVLNSGSVSGQETTNNDRPAFWEHLVAVYEKGAVGTLNRVRLYANGAKIVDYLTSSTAVLPNLSTPALEIRGPGRDGRLQNVVMYKGAMSEETINAHFNNGNGITRLESDLFPVCFYKGSASAGTTLALTDDSGNGNALTNTAQGSTTPSSVTSQSAVSFCEREASPTRVVKKAKYKLEVLRTFKNMTSTSYGDAIVWKSVGLREYDPFTYPTAPLLGVSVRATAEINGGAPTVSAVIKGRQVPVWDGISVESPTFERIYTSNPAWIVADMLLDKEWGLGNTFDPEDLEIGTFQAWADYCDELIYNQTGYEAPYNATSTGSAMTWYDIKYTTYAGSGALEFWCPANSIPDTVRIGDYIWYSGAPALPSSVVLNSSAIGAITPFSDSHYQIVNIVDSSAAPAKIVVRYLGSAPWTIESNMSSVATPAGTIQTRQTRFSFDGAIDEQGEAWDKVLQVCSSGRATPIRDGRRIRIAVHKPRSVVEVIGPSQVEVDSFEMEYLNPKTRFNQIEIAFLDEALNYERSMVSSEHPSIQGTTDSGLLRRRSFFLEGVTRRAQVLRQAQFLLNQEHLIRRKGKFTGSIDLLALEPLDVIRIAHDVADRGISGRVYQASASTTQVYLDRTVVLAAATTYKLTVRRTEANQGEVPATLTVTSAAGTYAIGAPLTVSTGYAALPDKNDVWVLYKDGEDLLASVDSITLTADLKREVHWTEYVETVYDVEAIGETPDIGAGFLQSTSPALGQNSAPPRADLVTVRETIARGPGGAHQPRVLVTWEYDEYSSDQLGGFDIYSCFLDESRSARFWELRGTAQAGERSKIIVLDDAVPGQSMLFAVCARSIRGVARTPSRSAQAGLRFIGRGPRPSAPAWDNDFPTAMDGEQAAYRFELGSNDEASTLEVRRGGWILGQRVGATPQDSAKLGPTQNWTSAVATSVSNLEHLHGLLVPGAPLFVRAISERGKYSEYDSYEWAATVVDSEIPFQTTNRTFFSNSWEDFGIGWRRSGAVIPNATLTGCQVTTSTLFQKGYLEFSGSNLTATYETADPLVEVDQRAEWFYNSAFCIAEQIWPTTWADATYPFDDAEAQWTWEGPLNELGNGDDPGRVSLKIEFRTLDEDDTYSAWQAYSPGKVRCQHVQWRLSFTRPTTSYQIRIYRFSTELLRIPRQRFERSGIQYFAEHQIFGRT